MKNYNLAVLGISMLVLLSCYKNIDSTKDISTIQPLSQSATQNSISLINLENGLVAYYPFNGNANDASGNKYNGVVTAATLTTDRFGKSKSAYLFTSNPQNITIPNLHQTNILTYSVSGWFLLTQQLGGTILSGDIPLSSPSGLRFALGPSQATWSAEDGWNTNGILTTNNYNFADNKWHNFIITFNTTAGLIPASAFQIFIDGKITNTITYQQNWPPGSGFSEGFNVNAPINNGTLPVVIGNTMYNSTYTNFFPGKLDDLRIYNRPLTQQEITYLATH